jgi:hypothetical protein
LNPAPSGIHLIIGSFEKYSILSAATDLQNLPLYPGFLFAVVFGMYRPISTRRNYEQPHISTLPTVMNNFAVYIQLLVPTTATTSEEVGRYIQQIKGPVVQ